METLPVELKEEISTYLQGRDLASVLQSERGFAELSREEKYWRRRYQEEFPEDFNMNWKEKYQERASRSILGQMETFIDIESDKYSFNIYLKGPFPVAISFRLFPSELRNIIGAIERNENVSMKSYIYEPKDCGLEISYGPGSKKVAILNLNNRDMDIQIDSELFLHMLKDVVRSIDEGLGEIHLTYFDDGTSRRNV